MEAIKNFILSSTGEGLSLRVQSLFAAIIPVAVVVGPVLGLHVTSDSLTSLEQVILDGISAFVAVVAAFQHIKGWVRYNLMKSQGLGRFAGRA